MTRPLLRLAARTRQGEEMLLARPLPGASDPWGDLAVLRGTPWGPLISEVSGEVMSLAVHGYLAPLRAAGLRDPRACLRALDPTTLRCARRGSCVMHDAARCLPCPKVPDCYEPPSLPMEVAMAARDVTLCWREGRYVVVVVGEEFVPGQD